MIFLPDVNIWTALTSNRHVYHSLANAWLQSLDTDQIAFCRITELGFLRLLTNTHVMGKDEPETRNLLHAVRSESGGRSD